MKAPQLGELGENILRIDENAQPKVLPCRKIPLAVEELMREELDRLVEKGVFVPVTEPWITQTAVLLKPSGKLRICNDQAQGCQSFR